MRWVVVSVAVTLVLPALAGAGPIYAKDGQTRTFSNVATDGGYERYALPEPTSKAKKAPKAGTPQPALHTAAFRNDVAEMQRLLDQGADVDAIDSSSRTALMLAASTGRSKAVQFLLEHGASTKTRDREGNTPLHQAASGSGNAEVLRLLLNAGADVRASNNYGRTPLHVVFANDAARKTLIAAGADPNATDQYHVPAVETASNGRPAPAPFVAKSEPPMARAWGERDQPAANVYHFDNHGSLTGVDGADGCKARIRYKYDANGNMTRMETPRQIIKYKYDAVDQLTNMDVQDKKR
jgi:YD repeat-containing protein